MRLQGKVAVIAGAGKGIGRAIAAIFAKEGARVVIAARREDVIRETARISNGTFIKADLTDEKDVERLFSETVKKDGKIDILVNNAGLYISKPLAETSTKDFDDLVDANLRAAFLATKHAAKHMKEGGSIINIGAVFGHIAGKDIAAYMAVKAALKAFTEGTAADLMEKGTRINCILPGIVSHKTGLGEKRLGGHGRPEDVASAALFFASDESKWITGASLIVDGGLAVNRKF